MVVACVAVGAISIATLQDGHNWGDDFAHYLLIARDYGSGHFRQSVSTPPLFPLLLAPLVRFHAGVAALKVPGVVCWLASAGVFYFFLKRRFDPTSALLVALCFLCAPWFFYFKQSILSDVPFAAFAIGALTFFDAAAGARAQGRRWHPAFLGFLACAVLGALTRASGLALFAAGFAGVVWFRLGWRAAALVCAAVLVWLGIDAALGTRTLSYYLAQPEFTTAHTGGMAAQLQKKLAYLQEAVEDLTRFVFPVTGTWSVRPKLAGTIQGGPAATWLLPAILVGLAWSVRTRGISFVEIYCAAYLGLLAVWSVPGGVRYVVPLIPPALYYLFFPWAWCRDRLARSLRRAAPYVAAALLAPAGMLLAFDAWATVETRGFSDDELGTPQARQVFAWVRDHSASEDTYWAYWPRSFRFITERRTIGWGVSGPGDVTTVLQEIQRSRVQYVLLSTYMPQSFKEAFLARARVRPVLANDIYQLYKVLDP
jgi:hypothetical protein